MGLKKGDTVAIIAGKERGKRGKVIRTIPAAASVIVEGLNMVKFFTRPSQQNPKGGIAQMEGKLHQSKVQLVCPRCSKQTRVGFQKLADGSKQRVCKKCNEII